MTIGFVRPHPLLHLFPINFVAEVVKTFGLWENETLDEFRYKKVVATFCISRKCREQQFRSTETTCNESVETYFYDHKSDTVDIDPRMVAACRVDVVV